ncbi:hypothetical protein HAX54_003157, partial [Datura stramonium]|nr:hypothetical protein [Datura stramonium]
MSSTDFGSNWSKGMDDYSGNDWESDAKNDRRDMHYILVMIEVAMMTLILVKPMMNHIRFVSSVKPIAFVMNILVMSLLIMMRLAMVMDVLTLELGV